MYIDIVMPEKVEEEQLDKDKPRVYFVIDMKSFFASVECAERGLDAMTTKLVVADETRSDKTICLAVSPALKNMGIKNRCRLFEIPEGIDYIIATPRMQKYIDYASEIYGIYLKYIDKNDIHVYSIDECIIDATDYLKLYNLKAKEFATKLMKEIQDTLHIPSTAGIGSNMYLAKIALDITAKHSPDRIGWLTEEKFRQTLLNHRPITDFWQISFGTASRLEKYGIYDMQGIINTPEYILYKEFGINAELLIDHAYGRETCRMQDIKQYKSKSRSISSSQILPCNYNFKDAKLVCMEMLQDGCYRLVREHLVTCLIHLYVGYGDVKNDGAKGTKRLSVTTNLYSQIYPAMDKLFDEVVDKSRPIRKVGYDLSDLLQEDQEQYDFFSDYKAIAREKKLIHSVVDIQDKFGKNAILKGVDLKKNATQKERNAMIGGHRSGKTENAKN